MKKLTQRQFEILKFITQFINKYGYAPSFEEIRLFFKFKSPNAVTCHLNTLVNKGYLIKDSTRARALRTRFPLSGIPIVGKIAAGPPIIIENFFEGSLFTPDDLMDVFALKITGDSMEQAHIYDGDYVIVKKNVEVRNGDIIAAVIGEEATIKYLRKEKNKIFLVPANPAYKPIEIKENLILGKVIGVFRKV
ncbi:MAG TPA: transcriptional repressor LexA [Candidatus Ratteibacteria bacterium]|jgi:repressor LexA|uniref:LexA repressor n=1 Tax=candidate division TA06 bacterium ADurb.Bin131 TaxID=1852827 RepID=A0A1V6CDE1_UNCT6|nr:MAG: LexA repressor [candidate division TA06 bacterium ADurb.Bin131]HON05307.1 transcriptional repressor LexA [bacterium]HRS07016.1 transcriptional repressor LexA [Candidatus Ratteibacteria bacterium]HRV05139.1 transcriptional repressor LexA [Candidatus Ratteibacteria bacterium]